MEATIFLIVGIGIYFFLLFLYSLMKIAQQSDARAGYEEGMLYEKLKEKEKQ